jgi:hypothetical protein
VNADGATIAAAERSARPVTDRRQSVVCSRSSGCSHGRSCTVAIVGQPARSGTAATELCNRLGVELAQQAWQDELAAQRAARRLCDLDARERRLRGTTRQQQHTPARELRIGAQRVEERAADARDGAIAEARAVEDDGHRDATSR